MSRRQLLITITKPLVGRLGHEPSCVACGQTLPVGSKAIRKDTHHHTNYLCRACDKKSILVYQMSRLGGRRN